MDIVAGDVLVPFHAPRRFHHRPDVVGDQEVIQQVFTQLSLSLGNMARAGDVEKRRAEILRGDRVPLILDAGAHIGASAVWFALTYPKSRVVAIEPDPGNGLNIQTYPGGISCSGGDMALIDPGRGSWGYRLANRLGKDAHFVPTFAARQLIIDLKRDGLVPFIAKIDIEGGEADLFRRNVDWIEEFALLIVELHDWMLPGEAVSHHFLRAVGDRDFDVVLYGEHLFCFNNWSAV